MRFGFQDLHLIAIFNGRAQRHDATIQLRADRLIPKRGVHCIGKIDCRRAFGQLDQFPLRREGKDAVLIHGHARMFEDFLRRFGMFQYLDQVFHPADLRVRHVHRLLVEPMRCEAIFGLTVHFLTAQLNFNAPVFAVDD